ncbi:hypothetical protein AB4225_36605 [Streptomyces sp. 2RAF24]|uniref:hypothetical protein n=1 Tax=Streptomyces sp. 2RAF24 TaxID=3232997 RepID=UPI003F98EB4F
MITHFYLGLGLPVYEIALSEVEAHRVIGANVVSGFEPVVISRGADGALLTTPDGARLTVVAVYGTLRVMAALAFVGEGGR